MTETEKAIWDEVYLSALSKYIKDGQWFGIEASKAAELATNAIEERRKQHD